MLSLKQHIKRQIITDGVYVTIFSYVILFSIFNTLYVDKSPATYQPASYEIENIAVKSVNCSFSVSGLFRERQDIFAIFSWSS